MTEQSDVIIIGAGPGGISAAIGLAERGIHDVVILEKSAGIGGTWFNNDYPGLACDIAADLYSFSFFREWEWPSVFARRADILAYLQEAARQFGVTDKVVLDTEVVSARWDDDRSEWAVVDGDGTERRARVLIGAVGMFNDFARPAFAGTEDFRGDILETPRWPADGIERLTGKDVAVVGTAASGIQVIPAIAPLVRSLTVFQRTAAWIFPKDDEIYTPERLAERKADRQLAERNRRERADVLVRRADLNDEAMTAELRAAGEAHLQIVVDPEVRAALTPTSPIGAQRLLLSSEYYATFNRDNVTLVTSPIERLEEHGVRTVDGRTHRAEAMVFATGYTAHRFLSIIDVVGRGSVALRDKWSEGAYAYLGVTVDDFPNLFMLYGPNTNGGSIIDKLEIQARYIVDKVAYILNTDVGALEVTPAAVAAYNEQLQADLGSVDAWQVEGGSKYFRSPSGRIVTQIPYTVPEYDAMLQRDDLSEYAVRPRRDSRSVA